ncbi:MAG: SixA phosphatase family protein [Actinomycetota bacterium]
MRLWLLRHAKSDWSDPDRADHDRPLAPRGERDAERVGTYLDREAIRPALVLCSSGLRARQTLVGVLVGLGTEIDVRIEPGLYAFDATALLERLRAIPPGDVSSVMLVGHNPAIQNLTLLLAGRGSGLGDVKAKFPTCALAEIELPPMAWHDVGHGVGTLRRFVTPRSLG